MKTLLSCLMVLALAATAGAAVVPASGYAVRLIPTPDKVQGGVARRGDALFVGQGTTYTGGAQSVIRLSEGGGATTIATGFNSLGGFDLDAAGTLYVVDNCSDDSGDFCGSTTTGDTVYAIPDALTRTTAIAAASAEVVPAGTIPFAFDVLIAPGGAALVSDPDFAGGRVAKVLGGAATDLVTGLELPANLALTAGGTLLVGDCKNLNFTTFECEPGEVLEYALDGTFLGTPVTGLAHVFGVAVDNDGNILVSGGSSIVAAVPGGAVTSRAGGFGFVSDIAFDAERDELLALDFEALAITAICRDTDVDGDCDADDNCPAVANAGQEDADGDGAGDVCDACEGPQLAKAKLKIGKLATPAGDDTLKLAGEATVPTAPALDLVASGVRILIDGVLDATIPGGAFDPVTGIGWKEKNGKFTYKNGAGGILGITKVTVRVSSKLPGLVKFAVVGKGGSYEVDAGDLPLRATFLIDADAGQCADGTLGCVFKDGGKSLQCK